MTELVEIGDEREEGFQSGTSQASSNTAKVDEQVASDSVETIYVPKVDHWVRMVKPSYPL